MKVEKDMVVEAVELGGVFCSDAYFYWFGKKCKDYESDEIVQCNKKCPFFNDENMMKWLKEGE